MQSELVPLFFAEFLLGGPWRSSMWGCLRSFCSMAGISFLGCTVLPGTLLAGNSIFPNLLSHCSLADLPLQHLWTLAPLADGVCDGGAAGACLPVMTPPIKFSGGGCCNRRPTVRALGHLDSQRAASVDYFLKHASAIGGVQLALLELRVALGSLLGRR